MSDPACDNPYASPVDCNHGKANEGLRRLRWEWIPALLVGVYGGLFALIGMLSAIVWVPMRLIGASEFSRFPWQEVFVFLPMGIVLVFCAVKISKGFWRLWIMVAVLTWLLSGLASRILISMYHW